MAQLSEIDEMAVQRHRQIARRRAILGDRRARRRRPRGEFARRYLRARITMNVQRNRAFRMSAKVKETCDG